MSILNQISRSGEGSAAEPCLRALGSGHRLRAPGRPGIETGFAPFEPGTLVVSPVEDNVRRGRSRRLADRTHRAVQDGSRKRRPRRADSSGLRRARQRAGFRCLPVIARRTARADPLPREENHAVRYRFRRRQLLRAARRKRRARTVRKWSRSPSRWKSSRAMKRCSAPRRFHPGEVTTSGAGGAAICIRRRKDAVNVIAKLAGSVLTVMVLRGRNAEAVPLR